MQLLRSCVAADDERMVRKALFLAEYLVFADSTHRLGLVEAMEGAGVAVAACTAVRSEAEETSERAVHFLSVFLAAMPSAKETLGVEELLRVMTDMKNRVVRRAVAAGTPPAALSRLSEVAAAEQLLGLLRGDATAAAAAAAAPPVSGAGSASAAEAAATAAVVAPAAAVPMLPAPPSKGSGSGQL